MLKDDKKIKTPVLLLVLDGWGIAPKSEANAIELAKKPNYDHILEKYAHTQLIAHGKDVGLPPDQPGNSEAGHMNIGAGRAVDQDCVYISKAINTGKFFKNPAFEEAYVHIQKNNSNLHIMGLLSDGESAHSDPDHLLALLSWTRRKKIKNVYLHLFTDGRDSVPHGSLKMVEALMRSLKNKETKNGIRTGEWIATIMGRFYAMDRKKEWSRTQAAYDAMVSAEGIKIKSPQAAITQSYNRGETDEFIKPYVIYRQNKPIAKIQDKDTIIFFNLRSDRARQLAKAFVQDDFNDLNPDSFKRKKVLKDVLFVAMTDFGPDLGQIITAFPSEDIKATLPMILEKKKQLYIAEKEKYAHVTYFFNGGYADLVNGEDRIVLDSPDVVSYDEVPEMSTRKITARVLKVIDNYDFITINFANADMIAHSGNIKACIKAVEVIDESIGKLTEAVLKRDGILIITSDHGNAENMLDLETKEMYTEHTTNPVPFILIEKSDSKRRLQKGKLADIAPTVLKIFNIKKPKEMTGKSLI